jgi:hypothetical protein
MVGNVILIYKKLPCKKIHRSYETVGMVFFPFL